MEQTGLQIRLERLEDYRVAEKLMREAFWDVYDPGCSEHYLLHIMRKAPCFVPDESFGIRTSENRYVAALHVCPLYPDALKGVCGRYFEDAIYQMEKARVLEFSPKGTHCRYCNPKAP